MKVKKIKLDLKLTCVGEEGWYQIKKLLGTYDAIDYWVESGNNVGENYLKLKLTFDDWKTFYEFVGALQVLMKIDY